MAGLLLLRALRAAGLGRLLGRGAAGRPGPWDPGEAALQEAERVLQRQRRVMLLRKLRREMEPPGPPPRSLSWQAMEQIRYLRNTFPEEWPVARLAQGFCVSVDVIQRVLRSKFCPPLDRRAKQDAKVLGEDRSPEQQVGPYWGLAISTGGVAQQLLPARAKDVPQSGAPIAPGGRSSSSTPQRNRHLWGAGERQNSRKCQLEPLQAERAKPEARAEATCMRNSLPGDVDSWDGRLAFPGDAGELHGVQGLPYTDLCPAVPGWVPGEPGNTCL
ncbi:neugrin isoform X2 [Carettochelys insculpta]|uniref:neugrin isoform X2 n=1 Tax=Carettochelys insculpta TaxID=44489 RepID=UPI003EB80AAC